MKKLVLAGTPSEKQKQFFTAREKYVAYGGARGGGKSWALRRKLVLMCLHYPGIRCLLVRRSYGELRYNHILPLLSELKDAVTYSETNKLLSFPNGSAIKLGYLSDDGDTLQYQGLEFDVIGIDEATQITEYQFNILKACLRGANGFPKRMYLTCNPGGVGHAWVKRIFIDGDLRPGERAEDCRFIQATVFDNTVLLQSDPGYVDQLKSLPDGLRQAWLYGSWDIFSGQFFPETADGSVVAAGFVKPAVCRVIGGLDYGFDCTALVLLCADTEGRLTVYRESACPDLTLSAAARLIASTCAGEHVDYIAASPDLWNRRQDSGVSGYETIMRTEGVPALVRADDRRVPGWRAVREALGAGMRISENCPTLLRCMRGLVCDAHKAEDCSGEPHEITHLPEALRYAVMSRITPPDGPQRRERGFFNRKRVSAVPVSKY
ncbi:MAG: phage terminase large subunit [Clostridia bacterium]|nr:phage terminase large subunit [Clostridia bacterium]